LIKIFHGRIKSNLSETTIIAYLQAKSNVEPENYLKLPSSSCYSENMAKFFRSFYLVSALAFLFSFIVPLNAQAATIEPVMVKDINPGGDGNLWTRRLASIGENLFFVGDDGVHGAELWKTDGTEERTMMVEDIRPGSEGSEPAWSIVFDNAVYFSANDGIHGLEIWKSDGTTEGTVLLKDINPSGDSLNYTFAPVVINDAIYFTATNGTNGYELWKSDGTEEGTVMVKDIRSGINSSYPSNFAFFNNSLYFKAHTDSVGELWKTDGTAEGTVMVMDSSGMWGVNSLIAVNDILYFRYGDGYGFELWKYDGTESMMVKDINPSGSAFNSTSGGPDAYVMNGILYFAADDGIHGYELWKSDGTPEGTVMVKDINPGSETSSANSQLFLFNNELYFGATDIYSYDEETSEEVNNHELWKTDGTEAGTVMVKNINSTGSSDVSDFIIFNNELYFSATDIYSYDEETDEEISNYELWKTDGTAEGTVMVADLNPTGSSSLFNLFVFNNELYFSANDGIHGHELWKLSILEDEGGEDSSDSSNSSRSISSTIKKSSRASNPNIKSGWKHPISAGPSFVGTHGFIPNSHSEPNKQASIYVDKSTHHDDLYIHHSDFGWRNILAFWNNPDEVKLPWTQGFNTVSEISKIEAKASFNGYPVTETDHPFIVLLGYDKDKLGSIPKEQLKIAHFNETTKKWQTLTNPHVYTDNNQVATTTNKFGYFTVVYPKAWWGR